MNVLKVKVDSNVEEEPIPKRIKLDENVCNKCKILTDEINILEKENRSLLAKLEQMSYKLQKVNERNDKCITPCIIKDNSDFEVPLESLCKYLHLRALKFTLAYKDSLFLGGDHCT